MNIIKCFFTAVCAVLLCAVAGARTVTVAASNSSDPDKAAAEAWISTSGMSVPA